MSWFSQTFSSSVGRKFAMALSGIFLITFLILHVSINAVSLFSVDMFNQASHFMGTNPLIQFLMQPILVFGVVFHFAMGFVLEFKNRASRPISYYKKSTDNATWISQNMIYSGLVVLAFLVLHFIDFWIPEMDYKYVKMLPSDPDRYYAEMVHKFESPVRTGAYVISFVLLSLHLLHGFQSSLQSVGLNNKFSGSFKIATEIFAIVVPLVFAIIAVYHYLNH